MTQSMIIQPKKLEHCKGKLKSQSNSISFVESPRTLKEKKHECPQCFKKLAFTQSVKCHVEQCHEQVRNFKCDICEMEFGTQWILNGHMKALHNKEKKKKDFTPLLNQGGAEACKKFIRCKQEHQNFQVRDLWCGVS